MNDQPHEQPAEGTPPWGDRPVPAPRYGQYIHPPGHPVPGGDPGAREGWADGPRDGGYPPAGAPGAPRVPGRRTPRRGRGGTGVTWTIIGLCAVMWGAQWLVFLFTPYNLASVLGYAPVLTTAEPWRMLTTALVHSLPSPLHLLLNMYTLYLFGQLLEPLLGRARMAALFVLSVLGGSLGVLLLSPPTVLVIGASGGIFGLFGAVFVFMRHFQQNLTPLVVLIVLNLVIGFVISGIAWQAHVGGLVAGALVSVAMLPGLRRGARFRGM